MTTPVNKVVTVFRFVVLFQIVFVLFVADIVAATDSLAAVKYYGAPSPGNSPDVDAAASAAAFYQNSNGRHEDVGGNVAGRKRTNVFFPHQQRISLKKLLEDLYPTDSRDTYYKQLNKHWRRAEELMAKGKRDDDLWSSRPLHRPEDVDYREAQLKRCLTKF